METATRTRFALKKAPEIKGFEVFSLVFSSFSKPKNHTEISRIIG